MLKPTANCEPKVGETNCETKFGEANYKFILI